MKTRIYKGIEYTIEGKNIVIQKDGANTLIPLEWGEGASDTLRRYLSGKERAKKVPIVVVANNTFGDYWKNCHMGALKVTKTDERTYIHIRYKELEIQFDCYKHPFHLAAHILKGTDRNIREKIEIISNFKSYGFRAGEDFRITEKGVFAVTLDPQDVVDE